MNLDLPLRWAVVLPIALSLACTVAPLPPGGTGGGTPGSAGGAATAGGSGGTSGGSAGGSTAGGTGGSGGAPADAGLPLDAWCQRYAAARYERELRCGLPNAVANRVGWLDQCTRLVAPRARAGAIRFDVAAGEACLTRFATTGCGVLGVECLDVFVPAARLGERCETGDCIEGYCPFGTRSTQGSCPVCTPFLGDGDPCGSSLDACGPLSYCDLSSDGGTSRCRPKKADGAACGDSNGDCLTACTYFVDGGARCGFEPLGGPCSTSTQCAPSARCSGQLSSESSLIRHGVCVPAVGAGGPCVEGQFEDDCVGPATCLAGRCEVVPPRPGGALCDNFTQCESQHCVRPQYEPDGGPFVRDGTCSPLLQLGQPCERYATANCVVGLVCGPDGGCSQTLPAGAACDGELCGALSCLVTPDGGQRCGAPTQIGDPCPDGYCTNGRCVSIGGAPARCSLEPIGAICIGPPRCASFRCDDDGGSRVCAESCFP